MNRENFKDEARPAVLAATDDLVLESAEAARELRRLVEAGPCDIVLDLRQATYVSGIGLGLVADAAKKVRQKGGDLKLVVSRPEIRRLFKLGELDSLLEFYEDVESACAAFGPCVGEVERTLLWGPFNGA